MRSVVVLLASALVMLPALLVAQQSATKPPVFRTGVELLTVDVTVVDADGRQVTDLSPAEFSVEIEGDPRAVVSADYVPLVNTAPPQPSGPRPRSLPATRRSSRATRAASRRGGPSCCWWIRAISARARPGR